MEAEVPAYLQSAALQLASGCNEERGLWCLPLQATKQHYAAS